LQIDFLNVILQDMLKRHLFKEVIEHLEQFPVVAILGCRQTGKTTLAHQVQDFLNKKSLYLDLELLEDRQKFNDPQLMLEQHTDKLLILDEIQQVPELFAIMRGIIDRRRRNGDKAGHYLILGSASPNLLKQSSESLAGRIAYLELNTFSLEEVEKVAEDDSLNLTINRLWLRGGFPDSFLEENDERSFKWRKQFINTYLERDMVRIGPKFPADRIFRLWSMLAYDQGTIINSSRLATSLEMSVSSVRSYMEAMSDLFLIRFLRPWSGNSKKRLVKSPKVYVRDSGILHALTNLKTLDEITNHSLCGFSWEGFVIEQILQKIPYGIDVSFYRSSTGDEIDLILEMPQQNTVAIEIKRASAPKISKGFNNACDEIKAKKRYYILPKGEAYPLNKETIAIGLKEFLKILPNKN
jgi:predicted AAA+ superfamily ATPase